MIDLVMTGMCKDCTKADLELDYIEIESFDMPCCQKHWNVKCNHEDVCEMWREKQEDK